MHQVNYKQIDAILQSSEDSIQPEPETDKLQRVNSGNVRY